MSMTESEALGMLRAKLTCMELEDLACVEKGCDKDCDNCNYCYEQGNRGQSKEALSVAISALEKVQKIKGLGDCYIIPKNSTWEVNGIDIHTALSEIQQYREIGTVSEFRELKEKAIPKKPKFFKIYHGKHTWERKENGEIDDFAWDYAYCNGVVCEVCGETQCVHCNPNYDELEDCEESYYECPDCGKKLYSKLEKMCDCGCIVDWSEGKE